MPISVANLLLQITGDADDARRELGDVAADLAAFGRDTAEAEVGLDTAGATATLDELKAKLAKFSADDVSAEVNVQIAEAQAKIVALQAELDHLDGENVTIDVRMREGLTSRIGSLVRDVERLGTQTENVAGGGLSDFTAGLGGLQGLVGPIAVAIGGALVAALAAAGASLVEAAAGAGALVTAFLSLGGPAVAAAVGAVANFKDEADTAGTAAHGLKETAGELWDAFKGGTKGGSNALFRGLTEALKDLKPLVHEMGPAFKRLGEAGGKAFGALGKEFSSPAWRKFFTFVTESLTELTPIFARSFGAFSRILRNIATASMPFLVKGFRDMAKWLESIADKTNHIGKLRSGIGDLVDQLKAWLKFGKALGEVFLGFLEAAAPAGEGLVKWLTKGAEALADWEKSKKGRQEIRAFFHDVMPLVKEFLTLLGHVAVIFLQLVRFFAPLGTAVLHGLNSIATALSEVIDWLTKLDRATNFGKIGKAISDAVGGIADTLSGAIHSAGEAGSKIGGAIADAISASVHAVGNAASAVVHALLKPFDLTQTLSAKVGDFMSAAWERIKKWASAFGGAAASLGHAVVSHIVDVVKAVPGKVADFMSAAKDKIASWAGNFASAAGSAAHQLVGAFADVVKDLPGKAAGFLGSVKDKIVEWGDNFKTAAEHGAESLVNGFIHMIEKLPGAVKNALSAAAGIPGDVGRAIAAWVNEHTLFGDHVHIGLPGPVPDINFDMPSLAVGARDFMGGLAEVGERGRELVFLPQGADVFTANETRKILRALADGVANPMGSSGGAPVLAGVGGGGGTTIVNNITPIAGGGSPDPEALAAQINAKLRTRVGT